jgi:hypothetical protein
MAFELRSGSFADQGVLPREFVHHAMGAGGDNVSPDLSWSGAPEGTQSFALTLHDPDAPTGSGWWHWVVYDIPAGARMGRTDFGSAEYGGAAPPPGHGPHRYVFTLYALGTPRLDVPPDCTAAYVGFNIHFAKIGEARLTALYQR